MDKKFNPWRRALKEFRSTAPLPALLKGNIHARKVLELPCPVQNRYYAGTNSGLYAIQDRDVVRLLPGHFYGIAVSSEYFYVSAYFGKLSVVLKGSLADLQAGRSRSAMEVILSADVASTHSRVHQLYFSNGTLYIANTGRNAILEYDEASAKLGQETFPFVDRFGSPILHDNNHINGVSAYNDYLLFSAYRAGNGSLMGVIKNGEVIGYHYPNKGVHEFFVDHDDFYFGDTFGTGEEGKGGALIHQKGKYASLFDNSPGWIIRGISGQADGELLVGHSHKGERAKRFKGQAALLKFEGGKFERELSGMPWAQTYQLSLQNGEAVRCNEGLSPLSHQSLLEKLQHLLGEPVYREKVIQQT